MVVFECKHAVGEVVSYITPEVTGLVRYARIQEVKFDEKSVFYRMSDCDAYNMPSRMPYDQWIPERFVQKRFTEQ